MVDSICHGVYFSGNSDASYCSARAHGCDHSVQEAVREHGSAGQGKAWNTACDNVSQKRRGVFRLLKGKDRILVSFQYVENEIAYGYQVRKHGCNTGAKNFVALWQQDEHEQRIQNHVEYSAYSDAVAGYFGLTDGADQMRQRGREDRRNAADDDRDPCIIEGVINAACVTADSHEEWSGGENQYQTVAEGCDESAADCRVKGLLRPFHVSDAEGSCQNAGTANSEQIAERRHHVVDWQAE